MVNSEKIKAGRLALPLIKLKLVFGVPWWTGVVSVTVLIPDPAVGAVDDDLALLVLGNVSGGVNGI